MDASSFKRKNYGPGGGSHSYNWNSKKKYNQQRNWLKPGLVGFLCTCNSREKDCIRESYNVLNEYADKLSESLKSDQDKEISQKSAGDAEGDIEDELKKEVSDMKFNQHDGYRFSVVDTGVKNNIFIKTTLEDPVLLASTIMNDVALTKKQKGRFLMRIVPVEVTCKAQLEDIKKAGDTLFDKHFRTEPTTFAIVVNKRYNDNLLRDEVITALALLVTDKNKEHKANLKEAKHTVLVEIMKGICCLSVLEDYKKLRHYNLAELAKPEAEGDAKERNGVKDKDEEQDSQEEKDVVSTADDIKQEDDAPNNCSQDEMDHKETQPHIST